MSEIDKKKRGRPLKEGAKRNVVNVKLNDDDFKMLNEAVQKYGVSRSDILQEGVKLAITELKNKYPDDEDDYYDYDYWDEYEEECDENDDF